MPKQRPGQIGAYWLSRNRHGAWCRTWYDGARRQTRQHSLGTTDFEAAFLALAQWIVVNEKLERAPPADVPVATALARYYERHAKHTESADAAKRARDKLEAFFGDAMIADLTLDRQAEFEAELKARGLSNGYIGRIQTTLKAAVNRAYRNQEIAHAPYIRVLAAGQRDRILSIEQVAALFNADPPEHIWMFLLLLVGTLARPTALLELRPHQIDFDNRLIRLNPPGREQTKKRRPTVPLVDTLLPWLMAADKRAFVVQPYKRQMRPIRSVKTTWRKLRKRAGLPGDVVPTSIRHAVATELRRRGVPRWEIEGFLGHSSDSTSEIYAKYAPDYLGTAAAAIDAYFAELEPLVKRPLVQNVTSIRGRK